jgi:hypothetical protein
MEKLMLATFIYCPQGYYVMTDFRPDGRVARSGMGEAGHVARRDERLSVHATPTDLGIVKMRSRVIGLLYNVVEGITCGIWRGEPRALLL